MSSRPGGAPKRPRTVPAMRNGKGGKGSKGGNKSGKGKGDEEGEGTKERNYHWCPTPDTEIGGWLHQQVANKGSGKFSIKRSDDKCKSLELGNIT